MKNFWLKRRTRLVDIANKFLEEMLLDNDEAFEQVVKTCWKNKDVLDSIKEEISKDVHLYINEKPLTRAQIKTLLAIKSIAITWGPPPVLSCIVTITCPTLKECHINWETPPIFDHIII